jgi:DNA-binding response OmpR family regulator
MYSGAIVYMRKPYNLHLMLVNIQNILQVVKPTLNVFGSGSSRRQITQGLWLDAAESCLVDEHQAGTVKIGLSCR